MSTTIESCRFHGLEALRLGGPDGASAVVSLLGGQLLSWVTAEGHERLFLSERAVLDGSQPIRGGVPVCFPQFAALGPLPKHGFLRTLPWECVSQRTGSDYALLTLAATDSASTRTLWPHSFRVELTVMIEANQLDLELCVGNLGAAPFTFTTALHTYLRVTDVEQVRLGGLQGLQYRDAAAADRIVEETAAALTLSGETDRVYRQTRQPIVVSEGASRLFIASEGFTDVVVWNPGAARAAALADMVPAGWRSMLCVEAACADSPVTVMPGEEWYGRQGLSLEAPTPDIGPGPAT